MKLKEECPDCGYDRLYGPVSDYWGQSCPDCGWEGKEMIRNTGRIRAVAKCTLVAGHFLRPPYKGKCSRPHGHNFEIEAVFETDKPDARGFAGVDFDDFKNALMKYDHQMLNDIPPFDQIQPSAENIAIVLGRLYPSCVRVRVAETANGYAEWVTMC
jgi:6-pyruvoyl-tetrahydropterin synthase